MSGAPQSCAVLLPALPLQLLWKRRPEWRNDAVAIVADETPEAPLLMLSRAAYARGLRPGLRQGAARSMALDLRTAVIDDASVESLCDEIGRALQTFSPRVERANDSHAFFVDPTGFERLYGGTHVWAKTIDRYLQGRGLRGSIVVGYERYRCLALAHRVTKAPRILASEEEERRKSNAIELRALSGAGSLGFPEKLCAPLAMLGIERLGEFLALPAGQLRTRFGRAAAELHGRYGSELQLPLQPMAFEEPRRRVMEVMPPDRDRERLLFSIKKLLDGLVQEVSERGERISVLHLECHLEQHGRRRLSDEERLVKARLQPASPSCDVRSLLELLRLRFARLELPAAVSELTLEAEVVPVHGEQLLAAGQRPTRDVHAAAEALARAQATFGQEAVCQAVLREGHLPESTYRWEAMSDPKQALSSLAASSARTERQRQKAAGTSRADADGKDRTSPNDPGEPSVRKARAKTIRPPELQALASKPANTQRLGRVRVQRRVLAKPKALPHDGKSFHWHEAIVRRHGPYRLNGGWWGKQANADASVDRDYYYAETASGDTLWVFFDRLKSRWFLHGRLD